MLVLATLYNDASVAVSKVSKTIHQFITPTSRNLARTVLSVPHDLNLSIYRCWSAFSNPITIGYT